MKSVTENTQTFTQIQTDAFDAPLIIPVGKLDADQYLADDLDGVTESIFGSGSMGYASLQASQTDAAMAIMENAMPDAGNTIGAVTNLGDAGRNAAQNYGDLDGPSAQVKSAESTNQTNSPVSAGESLISSTVSDNGNFTASTVSTLSASQLAANNSNFSTGGSGTNGTDGTSGSGLNGNNGTNGGNGTNGNDGTDNDNCNECCGVINIDLGDVMITVDNTVTVLGDTINNLTTSLVNITTILGDVVNNLDLTNLIDLGDVTNLITTIHNDINQNIQTLLTQITNITENLTTNITNILEGVLGDQNLKIDLNALETLKAGVNIPLSDILATDVELDVDLAPTLEIVNNIADLTGLDVLGDALGDLGGATEALQATIDDFTAVISDLDLTDPGQTVTDLVDTLVTTLENLDDTVGTILTSVDDAVGSVLDNVGITDGSLLSGNSPLIQDILSLEALNSDTLFEDVLGTLPLSPIEALVNDSGVDIGAVTDDLLGDLLDPILSDSDSGEVLADLGATLDDLVDGGLLDGGLLGGGNTDGDTDIVADLDLGILETPITDDIIEIALDPVEELLGDIDLDIGAGLLGDGDVNNANGDTDITLDTGIDLIDDTLGNLVGEIPLDPVEALLGDIDLDVDLDAQLLGDLDLLGGDTPLDVLDDLNVTDELISNLTEELALGDVDEILGDLDLDLQIEQEISEILGDATDAVADLLGDDQLGDWTESIISDDGLFGDLVSGSGDLDVLPDPVSTIADGLGILNTGSTGSSGGMGGALGGLRGLFG